MPTYPSSSGAVTVSTEPRPAVIAAARRRLDSGTSLAKPGLWIFILGDMTLFAAILVVFPMGASF